VATSDDFMTLVALSGQVLYMFKKILTFLFSIFLLTFLQKLYDLFVVLCYFYMNLLSGRKCS
jgi:hypothetical protein